MIPEHLEVWLFNTHIGKLSRHEGRLTFTYAPAWLNAPDARPLSQSLPLQLESFDDRSTRPFFAGLLPEAYRFNSKADERLNASASTTAWMQ